MRTDPNWRIGTGKRVDLCFEQTKKFQTSPGQYEPKTALTKYRAATWGFGSEKRADMVPLGTKHNPSPMAYDIPSKIVEGPKSAMH
jgi:hypothetical protein